MSTELFRDGCLGIVTSHFMKEKRRCRDLQLSAGGLGFQFAGLWGFNLLNYSVLVPYFLETSSENLQVFLKMGRIYVVG